jgi:hypothetical protein
MAHRRSQYRHDRSSWWVWPVGIIAVIAIVGFVVWMSDTNPLHIGGV